MLWGYKALYCLIAIWVFVSPVRADVTQHFQWVAFKVLADSEINLEVSNMHEFNGVQAFKQTFGSEEQRFRGRFVYVDDQETFSSDARLTWYSPGDSSIYRLYYQENPVIRAARAGDILVLARYGEEHLLSMVIAAESQVQQELFQLFALQNIPRSGLAIQPDQYQGSFIASLTAPRLEKVMTEHLQQTAKIPVDIGKVPVELQVWKDPDSKEYTLVGEVTRVKDGDSLIVSELMEIRLFGLDAPEKKQTCRIDGKRWDCGQTAKDRLTKLALGQQVRCTHRKKGGYGRFLSICQVGSRILNETMVREGLAIIYYDPDYQAAEREARLNKQGVWRSEFINPHDWRRGKRLVQESAIP
ncbi:MAG: thermonuclease family protein [Cyanobacteria bacterium P01_D01_bin.56]